METISELRYYYTQEELVRGMEAFRSEPNCMIKFKDRVVELPGRKLRFMHFDQNWSAMERIQGLNFNRIWADVRIDTKDMLYLFARLRSPTGKVDKHVKVFYKEVLE